MGGVVDVVKNVAGTVAPALGAFTGSGLGGQIPGFVDSILGEEVAGNNGINPFNITTASGSGAFNPATGKIEGQLSPEMQELFGQGVGMAGDLNEQVMTAGQQAQDLGAGFLTQAGAFDPFEAAQTQFDRLDAILEPGRNKTRMGLTGGLLQTGRLGGTSGADAIAATEGEIERQRQALLSDQFQSAQGVQDQMVSRGINLGAFGDTQQMNKLTLGSQSLQNALGIDAQQQAALGLGGQLTRGAPVEAQQGAFDSIVQGGLTAGVGALIGSI